MASVSFASIKHQCLGNVQCAYMAMLMKLRLLSEDMYTSKDVARNSCCCWNIFFN